MHQREGVATQHFNDAGRQPSRGLNHVRFLAWAFFAGIIFRYRLPTISSFVAHAKSDIMQVARGLILVQPPNLKEGARCSGIGAVSQHRG